MATRKRNEWLEADASDDDEAGYDSGTLEDSRGRAVAGHATKRRKFSSDSGDEDDEIDDVVKPTAAMSDPRFSLSKLGEDFEDGLDTSLQDPIDEDDGDEDLAHPLPQSPSKSECAPKDKLRKVPKGLTDKRLHLTNAAARKTGLIYISRIPPFMKPTTLRSFLTPHAPSGINRVFLTPEPATTYASRKRAGGNKKRSYIDGWVEFLNKKEAKRAVEALNAQIVGGKKGGWYHDDVWAMKYLTGFKWADLTERVNAENAERRARMDAEIRQSTREARMFADRVEKAKMLNGMERKRKEKEEASGKTTTPSDADGDGRGQRKIEGGKKHFFRQKEVKAKLTSDKSTVDQSEHVKRVLSKIF